LYWSNVQTGLNQGIYNDALILIEDLCIQIANKGLGQLGLPSPIRATAASFDVELNREQSYDKHDLLAYVHSHFLTLTKEQKLVYELIMKHVSDNDGGIFFLDAPGGTGKTFILKLILAAIRSNNDIALALASSGIAATLLPGGRTAHSALKLPLNIQFNDITTCNISKSSGMGWVLRKCKLIVWDECTMAHKKSIEALHRSLKDLRDDNRPFGNALLLLAGDFRHYLYFLARHRRTKLRRA
jgi:hypothetical protein